MEVPKPSIILWMVERNIPLGHFRKHENSAETRGVSGLSWRQKDWKKTAREIVNGLSQREVAAVVAREWESFPALLRIAITSICGETSHSGNVRKGITHLDQLLSGKIRRRETVETERQLVVVDGKVVAVLRKKINTATASAERAFAIVSKPANYDKMSPSEKRRFNEEQARVRRGDR